MTYLRHLHRVYWFIIAAFLSSCRVGKSVTTENVSISSIKFLGEYIIPYNYNFKNTAVGGLSGIDYDKKNNLFYLISDDWSRTNPARFYTARIFVKGSGIENVGFVDMIYFLQPDGNVYPDARQNPYRTPDPESIRYNPLEKNLVWTSEGERYVTADSVVLQDPAIRVITKAGRQIDSFPLPVQMHMYAEEKGLRRNGVFEGMSFAEGYRSLYASIEEPLFEDGHRAGTGDSSALVRVLKYNVRKKTLIAQYAYEVDPVVRHPIPSDGAKINGISEILEIGKDRLLFVERSYSAGRTDCNVRVYVGDVGTATDISSWSSLKEQKNLAPIKKRLLFNLDDLGMYIGNIEGVSFGPTLPNGHQTLIFVADNNFRPTEKTQFLLFEIIP